MTKKDAGLKERSSVIEMFSKRWKAASFILATFCLLSVFYVFFVYKIPQQRYLVTQRVLPASYSSSIGVQLINDVNSTVGELNNYIIPKLNSSQNVSLSERIGAVKFPGGMGVELQAVLVKSELHSFNEQVLLVLNALKASESQDVDSFQTALSRQLDLNKNHLALYDSQLKQLNSLLNSKSNFVFNQKNIAEANSSQSKLDDFMILYEQNQTDNLESSVLSKKENIQSNIFELEKDNAAISHKLSKVEPAKLIGQPFFRHQKNAKLPASRIDKLFVLLVLSMLLTVIIVLIWELVVKAISESRDQ